MEHKQNQNARGPGGDGGKIFFYNPWTMTIFGGLAVGAALCFFGISSEIPAVTLAISGHQIYRNEKHGFELTFPETWTDLSIEERKPLMAGMSGDTLGFSTSNSERGIIFYIEAMTEAEWAGCQESAKTGIPPCATDFIARSSTTVFNYGTPQDLMPMQEERMGEVADILASFRFAK